MKYREIERLLEQAGWRKIRQKGSHVLFKHPVKSDRTVVPRSKGDVAIGTLIEIEKQSGVDLRRRGRRTDPERKD